MVTHYCGGGVDIDGMAWDGVQIWSRFDHMEPAKGWFSSQKIVI